MSIKQHIALWLANGETGLSSKTIAFYLGFGIIPKWASHPEDVGDFSRCVQLLDAVPELRADILRMKGVSKVWEALSENWLELERLYEKERGNAKCPETYAAIRKIVDDNETGVVRIGNMTIKIGA